MCLGAPRLKQRGALSDLVRVCSEGFDHRANVFRRSSISGERHDSFSNLSLSGFERRDALSLSLHLPLLDLLDAFFLAFHTPLVVPLGVLSKTSLRAVQQRTDDVIELSLYSAVFGVGPLLGGGSVVVAFNSQGCRWGRLQA